jgi:hypothetical protein
MADQDYKIPDGFCQCGCGKKLPQIKFNYRLKKNTQFIHGHNNAGSNHWDWKNGRALTHGGYIGIRDRERTHLRVNFNRYVREHILIAETVLGKPLPPNAVIHHINHDRTDNRQENLVICEDNSYHHLLHHREKALKACGHSNYYMCRFCKTWDDPNNMIHVAINYSYYHRNCRNKYRRERYALTGKT